jgi:PIN domain
MKTNYVLVDYENVRITSLGSLTDEHFRVLVFLGPNDVKLDRSLVLSMNRLGDRAEYVPLETSGKNALDFQIAYYLGRLTREDPTGFFHIISKDTGFDPLIQHLNAKKIHAARSESIDGMPSLQSAKKTISDQAVPSPNELIDLVVSDLRKRKEAKPGKLKTLQSTIYAIFKTKLPDSKIESIYNDFVKSKYVKVEGTKVEYKGL